ncbi:MAG: ABC transporter permease, partial [Phycisphaerales bacterium]
MSAVRSFLRGAVPPAVMVVLLLAAWQVCIWAFRPSAYLVPAPMDVVRAAGEMRAPLAGAAWMTG